MSAESSTANTTENVASLAKYIDHTCLKADATPNDIIHLCNEAKQYQFKTVCVNSSYVSLASKQLAQEQVLVCSTVGFPLGACHADVKVAEARGAIRNGAKEIDMVVNVGRVKAGDWDAVRDDIESVYTVCHGIPLKVIFETCLLSKNEIQHLCRICVDIGVAFVKTSTGFSSRGATIEDVQLMSDAVGNSGVAVKASGGIRTRETALAMIEAGATRLGTSSGVAIVSGKNTSINTY